jgi:hypothetical protein
MSLKFRQKRNKTEEFTPYSLITLQKYNKIRYIICNYSVKVRLFIHTYKNLIKLLRN